MAYHYAITKKYGPGPLLMKGAYTTIAIPAFTCGCYVFGDKCLQKTIKKVSNHTELVSKFANCTSSTLNTNQRFGSDL